MVKSNLFKDSHRSKFSIFSIQFNAKFKYSNFFNLFKFSEIKHIISRKYLYPKINMCINNIVYIVPIWFTDRQG